MKKTLWLKTLLVVSLLATLSGFNTARAVTVPMTAAPVKLAWDASPGAPVAGYALYYSLAGSSVINRVDLGTTQTATLSNLEAGSGYVFYVIGYDAAGVESPSSNVLLYTPPAVSGLQLSRQADGTMTVQFRAAAGSLCRVEYTPTLTSPQWQTLNTAVADANGNVVVNDPLADRPAMRFYRGSRL